MAWHCLHRRLAAVQREWQSSRGRMTSERAGEYGWRRERERERAEWDLQNETGKILRSHAAILEKFSRKICSRQLLLLLPPPPFTLTRPSFELLTRPRARGCGGGWARKMLAIFMTLQIHPQLRFRASAAFSVGRRIYDGLRGSESQIASSRRHLGTIRETLLKERREEEEKLFCSTEDE